MHSKIGILFDPIVETVGFPRLGEEDQGDSLAKVVELQTTCSYGIHDGCIVNNLRWNVERPCAKHNVGVCRRPEYVKELVAHCKFSERRKHTPKRVPNHE